MKATYPAYKQTSIKWLPEIPEHWSLWKLGRAFKTIGSGTTPESGNRKYYENGTVNWINTGDLNDNILYKCGKKITDEALHDYTALKKFPKGSIIVAMYGATIGKTSLLDIEGCVNQACCVLNKSKVFNNKFIFYSFLAAKNYIVSLSYGGGQPNISQEAIKKLRFPTPPFSEQTAIAQFLDKKTELINTAILKKQRLIGLLKEQKQVVINELLHNKVGKWEKKKLKFCVTKVGSGVTPSGGATVYKSSGIPLLRSQNIYNDRLFLDDVAFITQDIHDSMSGSKVRKGDVLLNITGGSLGRCFYLSEELEEANVNQHVSIIRPHPKKITTQFLHLLLISELGNSQIWKEQTGSGREGLTGSSIKNFLFPIPNIDIQNEIVKRVQNETTQIDSAINRIEQEIELIKEYKQSLIAEAVTGKINVLNRILKD